MLKVKDGYAKVIGTTVNGSSDYLLLSNGGEQKLSDLAPFNATRFYYNDTTNLWHCILQFTTNWVGSVTFMYSPEECQRDYWCLGNLNIRSGDIKFYIVNFSNDFTSLFKATVKEGTSSNTYVVKLWVKNSNASSYNPYGLIQVLAYHNATITKVGDVESQASDPGGTTPTNNLLADTVDGIHADRFAYIYNSDNYKDGINDNTLRSPNTMITDSHSNAQMGLVYGSTGNPTGTNKWVHIWLLKWNHNSDSKSWISLIAIDPTNPTMWYRTSNTDITNATWRTVLDSSNFQNYFKAGSNISLNSTNNIITISATNTWRNILVKGNSIGSANLNLKAGSNISLTLSGGDVTISGTNTWRTIKGNGTSIGSNPLNITGDGVKIVPNTGTGEIKILLTGNITTHTHTTLAATSNVAINATTYGTGLCFKPYYNNGGPTNYGNILEYVSYAKGGGQLAMEWSGSQTLADGTDTHVGKLYYRSKRDNINGWTAWKRLLFDDENAATATKLQAAKTLWGQSFDGTNNVSGNMTGVGNINTSSSPAGTIYANNWFRSIGSTGWYSETYGGGWYMNDSSWVKVHNDKGIYTNNEIKASNFRATTTNGAYLFGSSNAKISYLNNDLIFNTGGALRFGSTNWDWDTWAGLKYDNSKKTIYLGLADGTIFTKNSAVLIGGILNLVNINTLTTSESLTLSGATKVTSSAGLEIQGVIDGSSYATPEGYYTNTYNSIILRGDTTYGKSGILFTSSKGTTSINLTSDKGFIQFQSYGGTNTSGENNILLIGVGNDASDSVYIQTPSVTGLKHAIGTNVYTIPTNGDSNTEGLLFRQNNYLCTRTVGFPTATAQNTKVYSDYYVLRMRTYSTWDSTNSKSVQESYEYTVSNTVSNANAVGGYPANKLAKAYNNGGISLNDVAKGYGSFFGMTKMDLGTNYPNNDTGWFHIFQSSHNNQSGGSDSTNNFWVTQIVNKAGTTTPYIRSRAGGNDISTNWTEWKRILTEDEYPKLVIVNSNTSTATNGYSNLTNGNVHLNLINPRTNKVISSGCIKGSGATTVETDASGNIVVTSTAIPTSLKNPNSLSWSGYSSGSYDGSSAESISIPNNTNQLTNGAGYITSSGGCTSANRLAVNKEFAKGNNFLLYFNANGMSTDTIGNAAPDNNWWHIIRMNHGNNAGYFSELAMALNSYNGVYWRTINNGAIGKSWTRLANADEVLRYYDVLYASSTAPNATPNATTNSYSLTLPTTTVWNKLGIRLFNGTLPDNLSGSIYNYGAVISLPGSTSRFDLYYSHLSCIKSTTYTDNGLYYRTGWGDGASAASSYKYPWVKIIDSNNIGSQTVAKAGALTTNSVGSYNTPVYFTGGVPKACLTSIAGMFHVYGNYSSAAVTDYLANRELSSQITVHESPANTDGYVLNGTRCYFTFDTELATANNTKFVAFISNSQEDTSGTGSLFACNPGVRILENAGDVIARVDLTLLDSSTRFAVDIIVYKITTL